MAETSKYHPAFAITNVKSLIPITLEAAGMYHSWAALFKVLCRVHDLTNHIIPPTEATELAAYEKSKMADLGYWNALMPRSLIEFMALFLMTFSRLFF